MAPDGAPHPRRSLVVAAKLPLPTRSGPDLRVWQNVGALLELGPVGVFGLSGDDRAPAPRPEIELWQASGDRALAQPPAADEQLDWLRRPNGHPSDSYHSEQALVELERAVAAFEPNLLVVAGLALRRYLEPLARLGLPLVLDHHDTEAELQRDIAAALPPRSSAALIHRELARRTEAVEAAALGVADQVWACSEHDARALRDAYRPKAAVRLVPNTVDVESYAGEAHGAPPPGRTLVFPAMFGFPPSAWAALFLVDELMPRLWRRFPDARLALVGRNPRPAMRARAEGEPRITVTGEVQDVRPWLAAGSVLAVPLSVGSGTRLKVLEAFAAGVPVVSTLKGVEGLEVQAEEHLLVADGGEEFAAAIARLWSDGALRERLISSALGLVRERYGNERAHEAVAAAVASLGPGGRLDSTPAGTGGAAPRGRGR